MADDTPQVPIQSWAAVLHDATGRVTQAQLEKTKIDMPMPEVREVQPDLSQGGDAAEREQDAAQRANKERHERARQVKERLDHEANIAAKAAAKLLKDLGWEHAAVQVQGDNQTVQITVSRVQG